MNGQVSGNTSSGRPNLLLIDLLRGAAALAVVLYHAGAVAFFPRDAAPFFQGNPFAYLQELGWLNGAIFLSLGFGYLGVSLFFVISGFCIHLPYVKRGQYEARGGNLDFFKRRFWRLYPPYIVMACFTISSLIDHLWLWYYSSKAPHDMGIIGASWTVALEVWFYVIYAIVGRQMIAKWGAAKVAFIWFGLHAIYTVLFTIPVVSETAPHAFFSPTRFPLMRFGEWLLGAWVAESWVRRTEAGPSSAKPWLIAGLTMMSGILVVAAITDAPRDLASDLLGALGFAFLIRGGLALHMNPAKPVWRLFSLLGVISYSLYLVHGTALAAVKTVYAPRPELGFLYNSAWLTTAVFSCLLAAIAMYWLVERPSHQLARSGRFRVDFRTRSFGAGYVATGLMLLLMVGGTGWA